MCEIGQYDLLLVYFSPTELETTPPTNFHANGLNDMDPHKDMLFAVKIKTYVSV